MAFDKLAVIAENITGREAEIGFYEINIFNYETIIASLVEPLEPDMQEYRARLVQLLATEKTEKAKSELVLAALVTQRDALNAAS